MSNVDDGKVLVGRRYQHYKGDEYHVIGLATHSETLKTLVIYVPVPKTLIETVRPAKIWARPIEMWFERVEVPNPILFGNILVSRFTLVEEPPVI